MKNKDAMNKPGTAPVQPNGNGRPAGDFEKMISRSFISEIVWFAALIVIALSIAALNVFGQDVNRPRYHSVPASILLTGNSSNTLKIRLEGNGYYDETVVRFIEGATEGFDGQYDAWKLFSGNPGVPSAYTKTDNGYPLSINSLPAIQATVSVALFVRIPTSGNYTLKSFVLGSFPEGTTITVENRKPTVLLSEENFKSSFADGETYAFSSAAPYSDTAAVFLVHITLPVTTGAPRQKPDSGKLNISTAEHGVYVLTLPDNHPDSYDLYVLDMQGRTVFQRQGNTFDKYTIVDLRNLVPGLYIVEAVNEGRTRFSGKLIR